MDAENDALHALEAIKQLTDKLFKPQSNPVALNILLPSHVPPCQLVALEKDLVDTVLELKKRNRIIGAPLTLEEMLNPVQEQEMGDPSHQFPGGDAEIVAQVKSEMAVECGEIIEVDSEESEDEEEEDKGSETIQDVMTMCEAMERLCLQYGEPDMSLDLAKELQHFRDHLRRMETLKLKQKSLHDFFGRDRSV